MSGLTIRNLDPSCQKEPADAGRPPCLLHKGGMKNFTGGNSAARPQYSQRKVAKKLRPGMGYPLT